MSGACAEREATIRSEVIPNLAMLASGASPEYPAETLASPKMKELLDGWRSGYDYVVIDTPPVSMFTDAVVLGAHADAVLLVARASVTTRQALRHARDVLLRANLNVAGVVLNGVEQQDRAGYYRVYGATQECQSTRHRRTFHIPYG